MSTNASFFRRYPLVIFFAIAYATSFIGGYLSEKHSSNRWAEFVLCTLRLRPQQSWLA